MRWFQPRYYVKNFEHISIPHLKKEGIRLLLCDIDNTLVSYDDKKPNEKVVRFIDSIQESGIDVSLCSNATKERATRFSEDLHVKETYYFSCKPLPMKFHKALKEHHLQANQVALIGDQLFTDMLGGNLAGLYTILTAPISEKDSIPTKINRCFEQIIYHWLEKKGKLKRGVFDD